MQSCLYHGRIRHRRFEPKAHSFDYPVFYAYLDLDELDNVCLFQVDKCRVGRESVVGDKEYRAEAAEQFIFRH